MPALRRPRPALPATASPSRDPWGLPRCGWLPSAAEDPAGLPRLGQGDAARLVAQVLIAAEGGARDDQLAAWLAAEVAARPGALASPAWGALVGAARLAAQADEDRRAVVWASTAALTQGALQDFPLHDGEWPPAAAAGASALAEAVATGDAAAAVAAANRGTKADAPALLAELCGLACRFAGDAGALAIAAAALAQLAPALPPAALEALLPAFAAALAKRPQQLPWTEGHRLRMAGLAPRLDACAERRDPSKAALFAEAKFRLHLTDAGPDAALRAVLKAAEVGVPHELLGASLVMAAAERVLRADLAGQADDNSLEGPAELAGALLLAAAARQLCGVVAPRDWLELALLSASWTAALAALELPAASRRPLPAPAALPQTWDHGPEIAKIILAVQQGDAEKAIALLRAYALMALPEQPLAVQLREIAAGLPGQAGLARARSAALLHAGVDEYLALATLPERDKVLAAALRAALSLAPPADPLRLAEAASLRLRSGIAPGSSLGAGSRP